MITIFKLSNGQVVKNLHCANENDIPLNYDSLTEDYIEGIHLGNKYYIENKTPVLIPDAPNDYSKFDFDAKQWVKKYTDEQRWDMVRLVRYKKLESSDWTQLPDVPISTKEAWATYRQALRDITNQADPFNITWPTPPQ
jgi:hypothetical protein